MRLVPMEPTDWAASSFLQSGFWGRFKSEFGWRAEAWRTFPDDAPSFILSVLIRPLRANRCFAYIPHGPTLAVAPDRQGAFLVDLAQSLATVLPPNCVFIRFDPSWHCVEKPDQNETPDRIDTDPLQGVQEPALIGTRVGEGRKVIPERPQYSRPLRKASDVQPPDTVIVDLSPEPDLILAAMKPKWRYNIKLAAKKNVIVSEEGLSGIDVFYDLYETTSRRDGIALHPKAYYKRLIECAIARDSATASDSPPVDVRLWTARHEGQALASIITLFYGNQAVYLYGASSDEKRNRMPAYALQWAAMMAARDAGCTFYDLYGIPPVDDRGHPMAGLYRFKTGFGGLILHYAGAWDYVFQPVAYAAFRAIERLRLFWHKVIKKRLRSRVVPS